MKQLLFRTRKQRSTTSRIPSQGNFDRVCPFYLPWIKMRTKGYCLGCCSFEYAIIVGVGKEFIRVCEISLSPILLSNCSKKSIGDASFEFFFTYCKRCFLVRKRSCFIQYYSKTVSKTFC